MGAVVVVGASACGPQKTTTPSGAYGEPERIFAAKPPAAGAALPASPAPIDGNAALIRMVAAYRALGSAHIATTADVVTAVGQVTRTHQETVIEFARQPARVAVYVRDTGSGTRAVMADGATVVDWIGLANRYQRKAASGSLSDLCKVVDKKTDQLMSPIVFLQATGAPPGIERAALAGMETVDGRQAQVVQGSLSAEYLATCAKRFFDVRLPGTRGRFTVWLDPGTGVVLKFATDLAWAGAVKDRQGQVVAHDPSISAVERTIRFVANPKLDDDRFRFVPPKGAQDVPVERSNSVP